MAFLAVFVFGFQGKEGGLGREVRYVLYGLGNIINRASLSRWIAIFSLKE
jgi:hypothetical protein